MRCRSDGRVKPAAVAVESNFAYSKAGFLLWVFVGDIAVLWAIGMDKCRFSAEHLFLWSSVTGP